MYGCEICVIGDEMQILVNAFCMKLIKREVNILLSMDDCPEKDMIAMKINEYKHSVLQDEKPIHKKFSQASNAIVGYGDVEPLSLPYFSCVLWKCDNCQKYKAPSLELEGVDIIIYNIFSLFPYCSIHCYNSIVR